MKKLSTVYCFLFLVCAVNASAKPGNIKGKVQDGDGKPLSYANVVLLKATDSSLVKTDYTNEKGEYNFESAANGAYVVKVMLLGYENDVTGVTVADNTVEVPAIKLVTRGTELKETTVRAQKPFIEVKPDMLVVNVENSIVSAGSSAFEVLQRSPGVTTDQSDNISLKGKPGVNVMINGKIQPISADQLANMLKAMPANAIEKIEIISNPSAKYDAAGTAGIINIVMKKDKRMGMNGSATIGYGQGMYPKDNAGFNLNYKSEKVNAYLNYYYGYRKGFNHLILTRDFQQNDVTDLRYNENHWSVFPYNYQGVASGVDYDISKKTTVGVSARAGMEWYTIYGSVNTQAINPSVNADRVDSTAMTNNLSKNQFNDYTVNAHLSHDLDSTGKKLTVDVDYGRYWNRNSQDLVTRNFENEVAMRNPYLLHGDVNGLTQIRTFKADYSNPFKNGLKIDVGIKSSFVTADNQPTFYDESNGGHVYDSTKSDHFIYNENINAAYINAAKDIKKWSLQLGLRAEQTIINGVEKTTGQEINKDYLQLFPSFAVQNHIDKDNDLGLTLSRRIERPDYHQLNPFKMYTDPTTVVMGNPYLQPALTYSAELSHTYKQKFVTTLTWSVTNNVIAEVLEPDSNKVTIQTNENMARMDYYALSIAYPFKITKWWSNVTNVTAFYSKYIGFLANTNLSNGEPTCAVVMNNSFLLPWELSAELNVVYQAPQAYGFMRQTSQYWIDAGLQRSFCKKKLNVKLNATDILFSNYVKATSVYNGYIESFNVRRDASTASLSLTYRFGNGQVQVRRHQGGAEDEMRRVGSGGA
jgi:hypothetical protein